MEIVPIYNNMVYKKEKLIIRVMHVDMFTTGGIDDSIGKMTIFS